MSNFAYEAADTIPEMNSTLAFSLKFSSHRALIDTCVVLPAIPIASFRYIYFAVSLFSGFYAPLIVYPCSTIDNSLPGHGLPTFFRTVTLD
ncbi:hypothetical protein HYPSUDRAFT_44948 [Hypholoma sublateritium FD-334 SS-4]|uniref:Uncharacterized protein n=1 Tax=Hypholoma sublateritium (strain FD-334 SS-4) TaxID=945553 RepID=A0A0D2NIR7_HYPSF|nr:hypothetical protein HYPSUDRAFT_44948 [Hypholoma sublateritium FD-334 SS-4]